MKIRKVFGSVVAWLRSPCKLFHNWYGGKWGVMTCGSYDITGPLPGEDAHLNPGWGMHRREKHCLDCDRREYLRNGKEWVRAEFETQPN